MPVTFTESIEGSSQTIEEHGVHFHDGKLYERRSVYHPTRVEWWFEERELIAENLGPIVRFEPGEWRKVT